MVSRSSNLSLDAEMVLKCATGFNGVSFTPEKPLVLFGKEEIGWLQHTWEHRQRKTMAQPGVHVISDRYCFQHCDLSSSKDT